MTITLRKLWGHVARPWGYEVRVDFIDDATSAIYNECLTFPKEPPQKELDDAVASLSEKVADRVAFESAEALKPPEPTKEELLSKVATLETEKAALVKQVADLSAIKGVK